MKEREEREERTTVKDFKTALRTRINFYSYFLITSNPLRTKSFAFFNFIKLLFLLIIPFQFFFNQMTGKGQAEEEEEEMTDRVNFVFIFSEQAHFHYISDSIFGVVLFTCINVILSFFILKTNEEIKQKNTLVYFSFVSVLMFLVGSVFFCPFLAIMIMECRCYFDSGLCHSDPTLTTAILNGVGILLLMIVMEVYYSLNCCHLPINSVPWSKPKSRFQFISKYIPLAMSIIIALEDYLIKQIDVVVILIFIFIVTSLDLLLKIVQINAYLWGTNAILAFQVVCLWCFVVSAIEIELVESSSSEYVMTVLVVITTASLTLFLVFFKDFRLKQLYIQSKGLSLNSVRNQLITHWILCNQQSSENDLVMKQFLIKHLKSCIVESCPCKSSPVPVQPGSSVGSLDDISFDEEQTLFMDKKEAVQERRRRMIYKILFHKAGSQQGNSPEIRSLEMFISIDTFNILYSTLFKISTQKKHFKSSIDQKTYFYLRMRTIHEILRLEEQQGKEYFNLEFQLSLERKFSQYQSLLFNASILVEKFWVSLAIKTFQMSEFLRKGFEIVDKYIQIQEFYQDILTQNPNYFELISMNVSFYANVMNFELETQEAYEMLKKIQQQFKLEKYSYYYKNNEQDVGMILVQCTRKEEQTITLSNKILNSLLKFKPNELIGRNISIVIPAIFHKAHEDYISDYLLEESNKFQMKQKRHVWILNSQKRIIPVLINVKTFVSFTQGFFLGAFFHPLENEQGYQYGSKVNQEVMILTDDKGYLQHISRNFSPHYYHLCSMVDEGVKINILELFPELSEENVLNIPDEGLKAKILLNYSELDQPRPEYVSGVLKVAYYKYKGRITVREYTFCEAIDFSQPAQTSNESRALDRSTHVVNEREKLLSKALQEGHLYNQKDNASSSASSSFIRQHRMKRDIDLKMVPESILNMRRAFVFFFLILLITAMTILFVSIQQQNKFRQELHNLELMIKISNDISEFRLAYTNLINTAHAQFQPYFGPEKDYDFFTQEASAFYFELKDSVGQVQQKNVDVLDQIQAYLYDENLDLASMDQYGVVSYSKTSFVHGLMQYLTKAEKYLQLPQESVRANFSDYTYYQVPERPSYSKRDLFFIDYNGLNVFQDVSLVLQELYIEDAGEKSESFQKIIMIICLICIGTTVVSSVFLVPALCKLDIEQESIIKNWLKIDLTVQQTVLANIENFVFSHHKKKKAKQDQRKGSFESGVLERREEGKGESFDRGQSSKSLHQSPSLKSMNEIHGSFTKYRMENEDASVDVNMSSVVYQNNTSQVDLGQHENFKILGQQKSRDLNQKGDPRIPQHSTIKTEKEIEEGGESDLKLGQLMSIYYNKKVAKVVILLVYSTIIINYNLGSYFLAKNLILTTLSSFDEFKLASERVICVSNSLYFVVESFSRNESISTNFSSVSVMDFVHKQCTETESRYQDLVNQPPRELEDIGSWLVSLRTDALCKELADDLSQMRLERNLNFSDQGANYSCVNFLDGILQQGLQSAISLVQYHALTELSEFKSRQERDEVFLQEHEFDVDTLKFSILSLEFVLPMLEIVSTKVESALESFIEAQERYFIILFVAYIAFLVFSFVFSIRNIIARLRKEVFRSRVLMKLMPSEELERIGNQENAFDKKQA